MKRAAVLGFVLKAAAQQFTSLLRYSVAFDLTIQGLKNEDTLLSDVITTGGSVNPEPIPRELLFGKIVICPHLLEKSLLQSYDRNDGRLTTHLKNPIKKENCTKKYCSFVTVKQ